jgi:hypothetical protein
MSLFIMPYRSQGERKIAEILEKQNIVFVHEHPLLIREQKENDGEKLRIWYPDFWLPMYGIVIEFWGRENDDAYEKGKRAKLDAYKKMNIACISVKPQTLNKDLQSYLIMSISRHINDKRRHFKERNNC